MELIADAATIENHPTVYEKAARWRTRAWLAAAVFLGIFISVQFAPWPPEVRAQVSAIMFLVPIGAAIASALFTARATKGKEHRLWRNIAVAMSFFFVGMLYRTYHVIAFNKHPGAGSFEDLMFALGFLLFVPIVILLTEPFEVVGLRKLRNMLDFATMLVLILAVAFLVLFAPLEIIKKGGSLGGNVVMVLYPVISIAFVVYLLAFKRGRWHGPVLLILTALIAAALGVIGTAVGIPWNYYEAGNAYAGAVDSMWVITFSLFALAAITRIAEPPAAHREPTPELDLPHWPGIASMIIGLLGVPILIYMATHTPDPLTQLVVSVSAAAVAMLIVARSIVITTENKRLAEESYLDPLTGLYNYRYFRERLAREVTHALKDNDAVSLCVIDMDDFDGFNRARGYAAGDNRLKWLSRVIKANVREYDSVFRIGGDDIAVILPVTDAVQAYQDCLRIARRAESPDDGISDRLRLSIGIASIPLHTSSADELTRFAEGAAYWAKMSGGERIVVFDPQTVEALDSAEHMVKLEELSHTRLVESLAAAVDARDSYTEHHSRNVARLAAILADTAGCPDDCASLISAAGLLHDIGKIGIPDAILTKPAVLEPDEYERIKEHPVLGIQILRASVREDILPWVLAHHEWWDGNGYPNGLRGEEIPYEARILAVCDAFDAMTSDRPYRASFSDNEAAEEILRCAGSQFDPDLARTFAGLIVEGKIRTEGDSAAK